MTTKAEKDKQKQIQDRCQSLLNQMLKDDDNKYCVDCDSKGKCSNSSCSEFWDEFSLFLYNMFLSP